VVDGSEKIGEFLNESTKKDSVLICCLKIIFLEQNTNFLIDNKQQQILNQAYENKKKRWKKTILSFW
jgi:hypothetical protein